MPKSVKIQAPSAVWDAVLAHCKKLDVEEDESQLHMYSVRSKTRTLTIWTQVGFRSNWYQAKISPGADGIDITLTIEEGNAPVRYAWSLEKLKEHIEDLVKGVTKS